MIGIGAQPALAAGDDYPNKNAVDCSSQFGIYSWCLDENGNGSFSNEEQFSAQGLSYRNCTDWVSWRLRSVNGVDFNNNYGGVQWGNANNWDNAAVAAGVLHDRPAVGAVAQTNGGSFGHVAWVAAVNPNGTVTVEEYNNNTVGTYTIRTVPASNFNYIHLKDVGPGGVDGSLIRTPNGNVYAIVGGAPLHLGTCRYTPGGNCSTAKGVPDLAGYAPFPADGSLIRNGDSPTGDVFQVVGGAPLRRGTCACTAGSNCSGAVTVDSYPLTILDHLRAVPADGSLIRNGDSAPGDVFQVVGGAPLRLGTCAYTAGSNCSGAVTVDSYPLNALDHPRAVPVDGAAFTGQPSGNRWRMAGGCRVTGSTAARDLPDGTVEGVVACASGPGATTPPTSGPTASPTASPTAATASAAEVKRLAGPDRFATAVAIAKSAWAGGQAQSVILARSDAFPDALAGTPLAVAKNGPLLLTPPAALNSSTANEIKRVLPAGRTVYLLGGSAALSQGVADEVALLGYKVSRLSGPDRYSTAVSISKQFGTPAKIFIATGMSFQNALISGVAAAGTGGVVVLTADGNMPVATRTYIDSFPSAERIAVGAEAATADPSATRITGPNAYDTAKLLAERYFPTPKAAAVANSAVFADALAGGAHIGRMRGPLLLSEPSRLSTPVAGYLNANKASIDNAVLYGGTAALSAAVEDSVRSNLRQ